MIDFAHRVEAKYRASREAADTLVAELERTAWPPEFRVRIAWVSTLYLDFPDRRLLYGARHNPRAAVKLRVREYLDAGGAATSPRVWVEVKERDGEWSRKCRVALEKSRAPELLKNALESADWAGDVQATETVRRIREMGGGGMSPVGAVLYRRFSVESDEPRVRLTVDRDISYFVGPPASGFPAAVAWGPAAWVEKGAVIEVKHPPGPTPAWCRAPLASLEALEYSKFGVLARLLHSGASAK